MSAHAKLSPSSSDRWLACSGSLIDVPDEVDEGSIYAQEGTAAHAMGEYCLAKGINAHDAPSHKEWDEFDSFEMRGYVQEYVDYVNKLDGSLFVEQKLAISPQHEVWGTADAVVVGNGVIHCVDLKYGQGVQVEADSKQLLLYGVGTLAFDWLSDVPVRTVVVHIVQPRRNHIVSKEYSVEDLATWMTDNKAAMIRASTGVEHYEAGAHCKWCRKNTTCGTRAEKNLSEAAFDFDVSTECTASSKDMTEADLVRVFTAIPQIRAYLDDVEKAVALLAHEHHVDGVKFVAGRKSRKINDEESAAEVLRDAGIDPYKPLALYGITELTKRAKAVDLNINEVLGDLVVITSGKPILVPEADKRKAITGADDFK